MKTPIFFVSDNHFQKKSDSLELERKRKFYNLLDHIKNSGGSLVIGGDFFDFWFDYRGYIPYDYIEIFERLKSLKKDGIDIYYVLGNHDYWDFGLFDNFFATKTIKDEYSFNVDNQIISIEHGDGIFKNDYGYRIFRKIIRSRICIGLFNLMPPSFGYYIAKKISKADKPAEYYKDNKALIKKLTKYAELKWEEKDVIILGHYHQEGIIEKGNKKLIFLGDWLSKYLVTIYDNGTWEQVRWDT